MLTLMTSIKSSSSVFWSMLAPVMPAFAKNASSRPSSSMALLHTSAMADSEAASAVIGVTCARVCVRAAQRRGRERATAWERASGSGQFSFMRDK